MIKLVTLRLETNKLPVVTGRQKLMTRDTIDIHMITVNFRL